MKKYGVLRALEAEAIAARFTRKRAAKGTRMRIKLGGPKA